MKSQIMSCRSDFISDGSSSDDESLLELHSLRERLARKRQIRMCNPLTSNLHTNSATCIVNNGDAAFCNKTLPASENMLKEKLDNSSLDKKLSLAQSQCALVVESSDSYNSIASEYKNHNSCQKSDKPSEAKKRKKLTLEEMQSNLIKAQEIKEQREKQKLAKEAEKQMKKVERESKKQFTIGSCLKFVKVLVDTHIVNKCGYGAVLFTACEDLGVVSETKELPIPFTIMWKRQVTECQMSVGMMVESIQREEEEKEVIAVIPIADFVQMVDQFKKSQQGISREVVTLRSYVSQMQSCLCDKNITIVVPGLEKYFREMKSRTNKDFKAAVHSTTNPNDIAKGSKLKSDQVQVSRVDVEEAVTEILLQNGCCTFMLETAEEVAALVRRFSKAVAERPAKKDRFNTIFSFHEEGVNGVKVDKNGAGLLKVWKQQLMQFKNISSDIAQTIVTEFPSPLLLKQAYNRCSSEKEAIKLLEDIVVRRGAGVLETTRRVGKELSRRIYIFFTSCDPNTIIK